MDSMTRNLFFNYFFFFFRLEIQRCRDTLQNTILPLRLKRKTPFDLKIQHFRIINVKEFCLKSVYFLPVVQRLEISVTSVSTAVLKPKQVVGCFLNLTQLSLLKSSLQFI